jgi:hypothetical protein
MVLLVKAAQQKNDLDGLEKKLRQQLPKEREGRRYALEYLELVRLAGRRDLAGLWAYLHGRPFGDGHHPPRDWRDREAAELLVGLGEAAWPFLVAKARQQDEGHLWACVLLARLKAPEALAILKERIASGGPGYDYYYALALLETNEAAALMKEDRVRESVTQYMQRQRQREFPEGF